MRAVRLTSNELRVGCVTSFAVLHLCQAVVVLAAACVAVGATRCATVHAATRRKQGVTTVWSTTMRDSTDDHDVVAPLPKRDSISLELVGCNPTSRDMREKLPMTATSRTKYFRAPLQHDQPSPK